MFACHLVSLEDAQVYDILKPPMTIAGELGCYGDRALNYNAKLLTRIVSFFIAEVNKWDKKKSDAPASHCHALLQ